MSKANGNSPAMPCEIDYNDGKGVRRYLGMTKRETMAMHIMAGMAANRGVFTKEDLDMLPEKALGLADALLEAGDE